ncbi:MAG: asparagine synthase (glutamine-hydrolyzing), partial [Gemmatimonadota bacterium]|nr:asparagine synthase (glutamine-hydrolyzing) [Gemmatimonadota bacterium]
SDTEVLLAAFQQRGRKCLDDFHGMFAFAVWDARTDEVVLARDRLGKKPLFYAIDDGCLYFASGLDALRRTMSGARQIETGALEDYLALGYIPAPRTIYRDCFKLEAGSTLTISANGEIQREAFWAPPVAPALFEGTFTDATDALSTLLIDAVRIRLRSDVPIGVFLSGGIDSSLLTAIAKIECGEDVRTFSIGFGSGAHDESGDAELVSQILGTTHRTFHVSSELLEYLPRLIHGLGEPLADSAVLPMFALARETRPYATVAIGGDGGDEGFGGYPWYLRHVQLERLRALLLGDVGRPVRDALAAMLSAASPDSPFSGRLVRAANSMSPSTASRRYSELRAMVEPRLRRGLHPGPRTTPVGLARMAQRYDAAGGDALHRMRVADIMSYLADELNPKVDVATMASAVEMRSPLLDHRVIEFGLSLPGTMLLDERGGKRILRELLTRYLPPAVVNKPKHGFTLPLDEWFREESGARGIRLAGSEALSSLGFFDMEALAALVTQHRSGSRDHGERLYALYVLDEWVRAQ